MKKFDWYMIGGASKLEDEKARLKIRKLEKTIEKEVEMPTEGDEKGTVWQLVLFITRHGVDAKK